MKNDRLDPDQFDTLYQMDQTASLLEGELDLVHSIFFNYKALQNGMEMDGIIDGDLRKMVTEYNATKFGVESLIESHPAEQYKAFIESTPYAFALEGLESILDWSTPLQICFMVFFPGGFFIWSLALLERVWRESKIIIDERERLRKEGFYESGANANDWKDENHGFTSGNEAMDERQIGKYQQTTVKAYPAKLLLEELSASYELMRIFCDAIQNNSQLKVRQLIPSLKKLGYLVDENRGKIRRDPAKQVVKGTMQDLGYGDPSFIKQIFVKTTPHTDLLPTFIKAMEKIKEQQKDKSSVLEKIKRFFKADSIENTKKQDKIVAALISHALKTTLEETEFIFKQSIQLMAIVKKYEK